MNGPDYSVVRDAIQSEMTTWQSNVKNVAKNISPPSETGDAHWVKGLAWLNIAQQGIRAFSPRTLSFIPAGPAWVLGQASSAFVNLQQFQKKLAQEDFEERFGVFRNNYMTQVDNAEREFYTSEVGILIRDTLYGLMQKPLASRYMTRALTRHRNSASHPETVRGEWLKLTRRVIEESKTIPTDNQELYNWSQSYYSGVCKQIYEVFKNSQLQARAEGNSVFIRPENATKVLQNRGEVKEHCLRNGSPVGVGINTCHKPLDAVLIDSEQDLLVLFDNAWQYEIKVHEDFYSAMVDSSGGGSQAFSSRQVSHVEIVPKADATLSKFPIAEACRQTQRAIEAAFDRIVGVA